MVIYILCVENCQFEAFQAMKVTSTAERPDDRPITVIKKNSGSDLDGKVAQIY